MRSLIVIFLLAVLCTLGVSSCDQMLDVPSKRALNAEDMWQSVNDARAGLSACYALTRAALANENAYWVYGEMRAGDFSVTYRNDLKALRDNDLNASFPTLDEWRDWRRFYAAIAQCNLTIENLPKVPERDFRYSEQDMTLDRAQALYLRAFLYFYMVRVWGDVPLVTWGDVPVVKESGNLRFQEIPRTDKKTVLYSALQDAKNAQNGLPWRYNGQYPEQEGQYRGQLIAGHFRTIAATKGAAMDLIAHIYHWLEDYPRALQYCDEIFNHQANTEYALVGVDRLTALDGSFRGRGSNNIWQIDLNFDHNEVSTTGQLEDWTLRAPDIPKSQSEIYVSKDSILAIYNEPHDQRMDAFFTRMNDTYPEFYKIKQVNNVVKNPTLRFYSSVIIIFRYEELYLLRAECYARTNNLTAAINDLNTVRAERSLSRLSETFGNQEIILDLILQERRRELIGEGWYWFDLVHFGKVAAYTGLSQADVDAGAAYWPVSKSALGRNSTLEQTAFWQ